MLYNMEKGKSIESPSENYAHTKNKYSLWLSLLTYKDKHQYLFSLPSSANGLQ